MTMDWEKRFAENGSYLYFAKSDDGMWHGPYDEVNIELLKALSEGIIVDIPYVAPVVPVPTQADLNSAARRELERIDRESIRSLREFIAKKFVDDPDLPVELANHEATAILERAKII